MKFSLASNTDNIKRVHAFSDLIKPKLSQIKEEKYKIDNFSPEELQDFNKILQVTDFILCKYENRKHVHALLKEFVNVIQNSSQSLEILDDEIDELVLSAESAIFKIKELQSNVSDRFTFKQNKEIKPQIGSNNLTKSSIAAYTLEYLQKTETKSEQGN